MPIHHGGYPEDHPEHSRPALIDRGDGKRKPVDLTGTYPSYDGPASDDGPSYEDGPEFEGWPDRSGYGLRTIVHGDGFTMRDAA